MSSEPIKAPINADTTTYDWLSIISEIDAILFQERSEIFTKNNCKFSVFLTWIEVNLQACSTTHFRRLCQVVQMMIKGFQSCFKVVCRSIYMYINNSSRLNVVYRLQADNEQHMGIQKHEFLRRENIPFRWKIILPLR